MKCQKPWVSCASLSDGFNIQSLFENDRSAARGLMSACRLIIFEHSSAMGNKSAQELFDRVKAERCTDRLKAARDFSDYKITLNGNDITSFKTVVPVSS